MTWPGYPPGSTSGLEIEMARRLHPKADPNAPWAGLKGKGGRPPTHECNAARILQALAEHGPQDYVALAHLTGKACSTTGRTLTAMVAQGEVRFTIERNVIRGRHYNRRVYHAIPQAQEAAE